MKKDCRKLKYRNKKIQCIEEQAGDPENKQNLVYTIVSLISTRNDLRIPINLHNKVIDALIDTGAGVSCIDESLAAGKIERSNIKLKTANSEFMKSLGTITLKFKIDGQIYEEKFVVVDKLLTPVILGFKFCLRERVKILFGKETSVQIGKEESKKYDLGEHRIITETKVPVTAPMYRLGNEMEKEAEKIIDKYLKEVIIKESQSAWRSPIILVKKKDDTFRLCKGYRKLN